jgi:hypothetical protein
VEIGSSTAVQWAILRLQWSSFGESGSNLLCAVALVQLNIQGDDDEGVTMGLYSNPAPGSGYM